MTEKLKYKDVKELNMIEIAKIVGEANFYALSIIRLNNGEMMYCGNSDELDKYCNYSEQLEDVESDSKESNEDKDIIEVNFEDVVAKRKTGNKDREQTKRAKVDYNKINGRIEDNFKLEATSFKARKK